MSKFKERFVAQCVVCAVLFAGLMLANVFGGHFAGGLNRRITDEITSGVDVEEFLDEDSVLLSIIETAREFFTTGPLETETLETKTLEHSEEANEPMPFFAPTAHIDVDSELLDEINNR